MITNNDLLQNVISLEPMDMPKGYEDLITLYVNEDCVPNQYYLLALKVRTNYVLIELQSKIDYFENRISSQTVVSMIGMLS